MPSQGSVVARVYTSDAILPLYNVPVVFYQDTPEGAKTLLAVRRTNSSGLTEPLYIATPDIEQSLSPNGTIRPYATVNIRVSLPGYGALSATDVQIFPGVLTFQDFQLFPVSPLDHTFSTTVQEIPQNL